MGELLGVPEWVAATIASINAKIDTMRQRAKDGGLRGHRRYVSVVLR